MKTSLNKIRSHAPCAEGWEKLLSYLGKTKADDEPLSLLTILDSNGLDDAIWCLRAVEGKDREVRLFAIWCARQVQHLMKDQRSIDVLDVAERYANGEATGDELEAAWNAARDAAWAAWTAWNAARTAARTAALAARYAVWAAWAAALAAAASAAWAATSAAAAAACEAACEAAGTTRDEMRQRQADELRRLCEEVEG